MTDQGGYSDITYKTQSTELVHCCGLETKMDDHVVHDSYRGMYIWSGWAAGGWWPISNNFTLKKRLVRVCACTLPSLPMYFEKSMSANSHQSRGILVL